MKKYTKPMIVFESFTLSTNVANTCEITDPMDEQLKLPGIIIGGKQAYLFTAEENCNAAVDFDSNGAPMYQGQYTYICYHNPTTELNLFDS